MVLRSKCFSGRWLGILDFRLGPSRHKRPFLLPFTAMATTGGPQSTLAPTPCVQTRPYSQQRRLKLQFPPLPKEWEGVYKPGQMYTEQETLPHLPVPPLSQTLDKYLKCVQPLVSEEELERTKVAVDEFGREGRVGEELQRRLLERAKTRESWLIDWWNHVAYLGYRLPVMVHSSPGIGFPRQPSGSRDTFVRNAARMALTCVKWNLLVQNEAIPVDYYRKKPMCMHHYQLYSKCRIPGPKADTLRATPIEHSRHMVVIRDGYFYRLDLLYETPDGMLAVAPSDHIIAELHRILETTPTQNDFPVGILTNEHRDTWYQARETLKQDPVNQATLDEIETSMFTLSLDHSHPHTVNLDPGKPFSDYHRSLLINNILHGNGSKLNSGNRWSDICVQLCISDDGGMGSCLEHTGGDGPCAIAVDLFKLKMEQLGYDLLAEPSLVPAESLLPARPLQWNISAESAKDIQLAMVNNDKLSSDVDLRVLTFPDFGKDLPKQFKLSPDGFMQTAIQLAYWKLYNRTSAMYESGATRWFKFGRTETIRSTSNTSHKFLKAMSDPTATAKERAELLVASVQAHSDYTLEAISGQSMDRHLLGLRLTATEAGMELPSIFTDPTYSKSLHFHLSTSQVPVADFDVILCFGAVVPDGYGVCYNPQSKKTLLAVSCFRSCPDTDSALFLAKLEEGLREMRDVLETAKGPTPKL